MEVKLYTPHPNQRVIHDSINNEPYKYYALNIGRQFGKSLLGVNQALYWFFNVPNCKIGWVSPVYKQCKKVFTDIDNAFDNKSVFTEKNKTDLFIKSPKGGTIQFFSSELYDNIRGETFDFLIVDETAWHKEQAWTEVLRATVLVRGKKVLFLSTPKGKNWFYNIHKLDGVNPQYKSFTMTSYDNPLINPSEIDDARLTLPDNVFRQEYLAEFIDGGAGVFRDIKINNRAEVTKVCYAGIDLGRADDYTVLTILNEHGEMFYCERWRHKTWQFIVNELLATLGRFRPKAYVEINSIGDVVYEQLKKIYGDIKPFYTDSISKQEIIENLQVAIQNGNFSMLDLDWLKNEFELFTFEYSTKSRSIKYSAPPGFHDDGVMSTAIAYNALKKLKASGKYNIS